MKNWYTETRSYNDRLQLTRQTSVPDTNLPQVHSEYRYSATQNDGRIAQMKDWVSGEEITYQYDSLNRLISAVTTGPEWGLAFAYDGFGNLTNQTLTKGTAPALAVAVDPATNRILGSGFTYDANGNITATSTKSFTYDTANRAIGIGSGEQYRYDPFNRKVWSRDPNSFRYLHLYGPNGELIGDFHIWYADPQHSVEAHLEGTEYVYFAGHRINIAFEGTTSVYVTDRIGSSRTSPTYASSYYPYGEPKHWSAPMFATYPRMTPSSGQTHLYYATNRWYSSQIGRFTTPDPYRASASLANPQSWNRYAYVENDPVNFSDPSGLNRAAPFCYWYNDWIGSEGFVREYWSHLICEDWGGGGGLSEPPDVTRPTDAATGKAARKLLYARLLDFAGSNCDEVFKKAIHGYSTSGLAETVEETEFYNVNRVGISGLSQDRVSGNGDRTSLKDSIPYGGTARTISGDLGAAVLLAPNFFANNNEAFQSNVLLHELLHVYTGMGDGEVFGAFAKYGLENPNGDTEDISAWLSTDCTKTPISPTWWIK